MLSVKRSYVSVVHTIASIGPFVRLTNGAGKSDTYGWRRWAASLLAIYDTKKMVKLGLPWWNVAATREVEQFLAARPGARVFEYGAGASTAWLAQRANQVVSVEHDAEFIGDFRDMLMPYANVSLMERSISEQPDGYVGAIAEAGGKFDLIVIDGRYRARCLSVALNYLRSGGIVLFDDSGRRRYRSAIEGSGLSEIHHFGRSFCVPYPDHTSILARRG